VICERRFCIGQVEESVDEVFFDDHLIDHLCNGRLVELHPMSAFITVPFSMQLAQNLPRQCETSFHYSFPSYRMNRSLGIRWQLWTFAEPSVLGHLPWQRRRTLYKSDNSHGLSRGERHEITLTCL
jgi:hypothetical protein